MVGDPHRGRRRVGGYPVREENQFLPADFRVGTDPNVSGNIAGEPAAYFRAGLHGGFAAYPDRAEAAPHKGARDKPSPIEG